MAGPGDAAILCDRRDAGVTRRRSGLFPHANQEAAMKQLKKTKLAFSTQTVRTLALSDDHLREVVGGGIPTKIVSLCVRTVDCP
jgi:hypothetical protein